MQNSLMFLKSASEDPSPSRPAVQMQQLPIPRDPPFPRPLTSTLCPHLPSLGSFLHFLTSSARPPRIHTHPPLTLHVGKLKLFQKMDVQVSETMHTSSLAWHLVGAQHLPLPSPRLPLSLFAPLLSSSTAQAWDRQGQGVAGWELWAWGGQGATGSGEPAASPSCPPTSAPGPGRCQPPACHSATVPPI